MSEERHDLTASTKRAILSRLAAGWKQTRICAEYDLTIGELKAIKEWAARLNRDDGEVAEHEQRTATYVPTPDDINAACADIQASWSDDERERRTTSPTKAVETVFIRVGAQRHAKHGGAL